MEQFVLDLLINRSEFKSEIIRRINPAGVKGRKADLVEATIDECLDVLYERKA